jgi:hypothetical protein
MRRLTGPVGPISAEVRRVSNTRGNATRCKKKRLRSGRGGSDTVTALQNLYDAARAQGFLAGIAP